MFDHLSKGRWWDVGLQLVEGCTKVSSGCNNCWSLTAANMRRINPNPKIAARYKGTVRRKMIPGAMMRPEWTGQVNPQWQDLDKIGRSRMPRVWTFWNDLFHPGVHFTFVDEVFSRFKKHPEHFFIICTKRPELALEYFLSLVDFPAGNPFPQNLMLMTTAENQEMADLRLPILLQIPGVLHGVSVEPGLGPISFRWAKWAKIIEGMNIEYDGLKGLDWVICGGETGPRARPMHPDWVRSLRDQCQAAKVPFFFKAWGEWERCGGPQEVFSPAEGFQTIEKNCFQRVGKKTAGRTLDGRTWEEIPSLTNP